MTEDQEERLVMAWETIGKALEGLRDEASRAGKRYWPEQPVQKETIWSHVENEEDRARKNLGVTDGPIDINKWLTLDSDESDNGIIGERSAQWLRDHPEDAPKKAGEPDAGPEAPVREKKSRKGIKAPESSS